MDIYPDTSEIARWEIGVDIDLTSATVAAYIGGAWRALDWAGAATTSGGTWTREATLLVKGANGAAGQVIVAADYAPDVKVTVGSEVIIRKSLLRFRLKP